jgi:hypothetical protein
MQMVVILLYSNVLKLIEKERHGPAFLIKRKIQEM